MKNMGKEKFLTIDGWNVVYNPITKIMTAGNRVRNLDFSVTDIERNDLWMAIIFYEELYANKGTIVSSFENLINEYLIHIA